MGGGGLLAQKYQPKYLRENDKSFKELTIKTTENGWIEFKKEAKINPNTFFKDYGSSLGLGKDYDFKIFKEETDRKQSRYQRFQLHYKNIPVEGVEFTLHSSIEGVLTLGHGKIPDGLNFDVSKPISENKALGLALVAMKLNLADFKKKEVNKEKGELLFARLNDEAIATNFRLAYAFNIYGNETLNAFRVYVDANTSEVIKKISLIHSCLVHRQGSTAPVESSIIAPEIFNPVGTPSAPMLASTFIPNNPRYLNGQANLTFETEPNPANNTQLRLSAFNNALNTRMATATSITWANLPDVINPNGTDWQGQVGSRDAQTAHWLTQRMHQYLGQAPNIQRNGVNGQGLYPRVVTGWPDQNASWSGIPNNQITFGRTNGTNTSWVNIDQLGHEYMHAVTQYTANLTYWGESGALNESISDIFGTALERNVLITPQTPTNLNGWNWLYGEDIGYALRSLENPPAIPTELWRGRIAQPDRYFGANWHDVNDGFDNGGVHINSGVMNKWFQTICTGQCVNPNIQINPIDFDRATAIVYRALAVYLQSGSNYADMRNATIQAARDLYGDCSFEEEAVTNAWNAANVGGRYFRSCANNNAVLPNGCYIIKAQHSDKALQPESSNNGARIRQLDANGSAQQIMEITSVDQASYIIQAK
ncbi:MAG: M4 family peptidase, partial [Runella slithyformis]